MEINQNAKNNLSHYVAKKIREKIIKGEILPKSKIIEKDLAEELQVSRGPVREALKQLHYEGLVSYEANKGCSVTLLCPRDAYEIFFLRGSLEKMALQQCGGKIMDESVFLMEEALEGIQEAHEAGDILKVVHYDELFHREIINAGRMQRLRQLWESLSPLNGVMFLMIKNANLYEMTNGTMELAEEEYRKRVDIWKGHKNLLETLKKGDLETSSKALDAHYVNTGERVYRLINKMNRQYNE